MKIENLKEGMVIKNYKELCEVLNEKIRTGESKQIQMKEFERFCNYEKQGQKIIIKEIYKQAKTKVANKNNKYVQDIEDILIEYLHKTHKKEPLSLNTIIELLGMANKNFSVGNRHKRAVSDVLNVDLLAVHYFYNNIKNEFKQIIKRALDNLEKREILNWNETITIAKKVLAEDENTNFDKDMTIYVEATEEEKIKIKGIEKEELENLKLKDKRDLFLKNKFKEFQKIVNEDLDSNWLYYFNSYNLHIQNNEIIEIEHNSIEEKRLSLNEKMKKRAKNRLKVSEIEQDEQKLIDSLIDLSQYNSSLETEIIKQNNKLDKDKHEKIANKVNERNNKVNEIDEIDEAIEKLEEKDEYDINDYLKYTKDIKTKEIINFFFPK